MIPDEKFLVSVFKLFSVTTATRKKKYPFYYLSSAAIGYSTSLQILRNEFKIGLIDRYFRKELQPLLLARQIIVKPILNGFLVIDMENKKVIKLVKKKLEPSFLKNENYATKLIPGNTPFLYDSGELEDYVYILQQYIPKCDWLNFQTWEDMLDEISPIINEMHKKNYKKLIRIKVNDYLSSLLDERALLLKNGIYMRDIFEECTCLYVKLFKNLDSQTLYCYKSFQHGDLTMNNVIKTRDTIYLFDFQNGGELNILYDLMIQEFYRPKSNFWKKFNSIDFKDPSSEIFLNGWLSKYVHFVKEIYGISVSNKFIRVSILLSLLEMSNKNFLRYQSSEGEADGMVIQNYIRMIGRSISKS